MKTFQNRKC